MAKKTRKPIPQVEAALTRCPKCGSTDREPYTGTTVQEFGGMSPGGEPHTHIVRRRTACRNCGQHRVDRFYENRAQAPAIDGANPPAEAGDDQKSA